VVGTSTDDDDEDVNWFDDVCKKQKDQQPGPLLGSWGIGDNKNAGANDNEDI
jgi:hypothetical protein